MTLATSAALLCAGGAASLASAQTAPAKTVPANAQEEAPEALLGAWQADVAVSRYTGTPPRSNIRTFSYTDEGKLLVTSLTVNAQGRVSLLHWAVTLDGTPGKEFTQVSRSTPASLVSLKKLNDKNLEMTVYKYGHVDLTGGYRLSDDGQTLTYTYGPPGGPQNNIVYRRLDADAR
jgi:hypothetical protein